MGKKKAFSKGLKNVALKKSPFKVADAKHKKKPKVVKSKIKQVLSFEISDFIYVI